MKSRLLVIMAAITVMASCKKENTALTGTPATPASIDASSVACKKQEVTLSGSMTYKAVASPNLACNCGPFASLGDYSGSGQLSHLGTTTSQIKPCMAPIIVNGQMIGMHIGVECGTLVAANGDKIFCKIKPYDLLFTNAGAVGIVKVDFDGGTGRFSNADGGFTAKTQGDATGTNISLDILTGSIEY